MTEQDYVAAVCCVELEVMNQLKASNITQDPFRLDGEKIMAAAIPKGYVLVPVEPTPEMLESVGTMEGWDGTPWEADENHINWYQAMIAAAQEPI